MTDDDDLDPIVDWNAPLKRRQRPSLANRIIEPPERGWVGLRPAADNPFWWTSEPLQRFFRPNGLIVTDAPKGALLVEWLTGADRTLPTGNAPIALDTFEWLERLDPLGIAKRVPRPHFHTACPDFTFRLHVTTVDGFPLLPTVGLTLHGMTSRSISNR